MKPATIAALALALAGCATWAPSASPFGRRVSLVPQGRTEPLGGELLAVNAESLWLARRTGNVSVALSDIRRVRVRVGSPNGGNMVTASVIVGFASGAALTAACAQVDGTECGGVLPGVLLSAVLIGGLAALSVESSATQRFSREDWEQLRPYARYPQGLPADVPREQLVLSSRQ